MICKVLPDEFDCLLHVINDAAQVYKGKIPEDCWQDPYMSATELKAEIEEGVEFFGYKKDDTLAAVMGIQQVKDVTLIRHAYVLTKFQRQGLGKKLLIHLLGLASTPQILVGTWQAAWWAIKFYEKNGFEMVFPRHKKDSLLRQYWNISKRQVETSVVLKLNT